MEITTTQTDVTTEKPVTTPVNGIKLPFKVETKNEDPQPEEPVIPANLSAKAAADYALVLKAIKNDQQAYATLMNRYKTLFFIPFTRWLTIQKKQMT